MRTLIYIALGGVLGSLLRYWLSGSIDQYFPTSFSLGTLSVNVLGCFGFGLLATLPVWGLSPEILLGVTSGFFGAFTTFSAFAFQLFQLGPQQGQWGVTIGVFLAHNVLGFIGLLAGHKAATYVEKISAL